MPKNKTAYTSESVKDFINSIENLQQKEDSLQLIKILEQITGEKAKMFGPTIVGFGQYHYKYDSGHSGDAPLLGFSPRKTAISLYIFTGAEEHQYLLEGLGKYKIGKACIYMKKLSDINLDVFEKICKESIVYISNRFKRIQ